MLSLTLHSLLSLNFISSQWSGSIQHARLNFAFGCAKDHFELSLIAALANSDFDQRLMNSQQTVVASLQFPDRPAQQLFVLIACRNFCLMSVRVVWM